MTHTVVLLVEKPLAPVDAAQVRALHAELDEPLRYHVLMPVEDAATRIEASLGSLAAGEVVTVPGLVLPDDDLERLQAELLAESRSSLATTLERLRTAGRDHPGSFDVDGELVSIDPVDALATTVQRLDAREAIVLTRPHLVAEFFHLDWTSRAKRKIGVPLLHLLEHKDDA
jgi:hypothetical protein